jgi:sugar/nucleoside kinase (ribokinase family)
MTAVPRKHPQAREPASVFFIGDVARDDYFTAARWPGIADKGYVTPLRSYVGGMIANAAGTFAGLGGRPEFISLLNHSPVSDHLCRSLNDLGISTRHMLRDPAMGDSVNFIFLVEGEHVVLTLDIGLAPMPLRPETMQALRTPGYLYTTLNRTRRIRDGERGGPALLADLRGYGRRLVLDLDVEGFKPEDGDLLRGAEVLIMNRVGFGLSFGEPDRETIGAWMRQHAVGTVIRTLADDGAEAFDGTEVLRIPGYRVPVVDVTGAGDALGGGLVFGLSHGCNLPTSLDLAVAAASRAVTIEGPQGGHASVAEVRAFQAEHGRRPAETTEPAPLQTCIVEGKTS